MERFLCSTTTYMELISFSFPLEMINNHDGFLHLKLLSHKIICSAAMLLLCPYYECYPVLCSDRAQWSLVPIFCSCVPRKSQFFHTSQILGTLDFTVLGYWLPSIFLKAQPCNQFYALQLLQFVNLNFVSMPVRSC